MWNKIGKWLDYPKDWCCLLMSLAVKLLKYIGILVWVNVLALPFLFVTGLVTITGNDAREAYYVFNLLSGLCWLGSHLFLKGETEWYPRLLNKLPSCPKINWNKGE